MTKKIGVLLTNSGTPDAPTTKAVRTYLREFLSDKRIVQLPRLIWLPILYGLILPTRPSKSAKLYQSIWTSHGSPMRVFMQTLRDKLSAVIAMPVEIGMNYGNPSVRTALDKLHQQQVDQIIVLPLYPQQSYTTTYSSFDHVTLAQNHASTSRDLVLIKNYADHPAYIRALAASIQTTWQTSGGARHLLISFHGIPKSFVSGGDPYQNQCELTATLLASELQLPNDQWTLCYQSQFGYAKWLQPATFDLLTSLPLRGVKAVDVICPGFAVDCLETLEEIAIRGKEVFHQAGGQTLRYIPALNDSDTHVEMLKQIINRVA